LHVPERGEDRRRVELHNCHGIPEVSHASAGHAAPERCASRDRRETNACRKNSFGILNQPMSRFDVDDRRENAGTHESRCDAIRRQRGFRHSLDRSRLPGSSLALSNRPMD
jgi:hypothetical protein